ncbi:MAG TPA: amidohydrolase [Thermoanaerobaculia bacterium]|nr:amidohydrolase [Thermoanaerobaculia bacterium]
MRRPSIAVALGLVALAATGPPARAAGPADLVLKGGAVYTVDGARSWAEAVALSDGRIVFVGTAASVKPWIGSRTRVVDLAGKMVLPAFHDSHVHPISGGMEALECDLHGLATAEEALEAVRRYAAAHPEAKWIRGGGWDLTLFPAGNPSKALLDRIVPDRPVLLDASDGHSAWANSRALEIAGITKATPDPPLGRIERDASGQPSGALREDAVGLVAKRMPRRTAKDYEEGLRKGLQIANAYGLTSLEEASASERDLAAYEALDARGELTARVSASITADTDKVLADVPRLKELRARFRGKRFHADAVKIFADGVLETRTAAVLVPYIGFGDDRGKANLDPADFRALATALDREGFQIHVHAIGDRAIRDTLDALEAAQKANGVRDARHHIAHLELIDPADIPRFRRLGVIANFQPFWANGDQYLTELTEPELGPARSRWLYPIASLVAAGAVTAFGSDWSVSSMNPLDGIEVAVTHREPPKGPGPAWLPEERIGLADAIAGYTIRGAYLDFTEKETGSIEAGKAADLIVLDRNLFEIPPSQIHETRVLWTLLEGKEVYRAEGFSP